LNLEDERSSSAMHHVQAFYVCRHIDVHLQQNDVSMMTV
jgi:hypothetical protein